MLFNALSSLTKKAIDKSSDNDLLAGSPGLKGVQEKLKRLRQTVWPESLLTGEFVVFDTETTGLNYKKGDEIISLGAVRIRRGEITDHFHEYVNPMREIPAIATEITGITDNMVADSPDILEILDRFLTFKGTTPLVAHNAAFDLGFLNQKLRKYCGYKLPTPVLDTFILSHLLFPRAEHHSLDQLAQTYGISDKGRHTALGDAIITARVYTAMTQDLREHGITTTHELYRYLQYKRITWTGKE